MTDQMLRDLQASAELLAFIVASYQCVERASALECVQLTPNEMWHAGQMEYAKCP